MLCLLALSACSSENITLTQQRENEITVEVNSAFDGLAEAARALDHERYFSYFDKDKYTTLNADGTVLHSLEAFQSAYFPQVAYTERYNSLTFDNVKIDVIDANNAVLVNEYTAEVVLKSGNTVTASGAGTQVWSRRTGEWKLVHVASSAKETTPQTYNQQ